MQIKRFTKIVAFVTSLGFTFLSCIALFDFLLLFGFTVTFALFVRMRWGFRLCGGDHGLCPLDSHKPLKRLDRNFRCFCAVTFAWFSRFCALLPARLLSLGSHLFGRVPQKIKNYEILLYCRLSDKKTGRSSFGTSCSVSVISISQVLLLLRFHLQVLMQG